MYPDCKTTHNQNQCLKIHDFCHFLTNSMIIPGLENKNHFQWLSQDFSRPFLKNVIFKKNVSDLMLWSMYIFLNKNFHRFLDKINLFWWHQYIFHFLCHKQCCQHSGLPTQLGYFEIACRGSKNRWPKIGLLFMRLPAAALFSSNLLVSCQFKRFFGSFSMCKNILFTKFRN